MSARRWERVILHIVLGGVLLCATAEACSGVVQPPEGDPGTVRWNYGFELPAAMLVAPVCATAGWLLCLRWKAPTIGGIFTGLSLVFALIALAGLGFRVNPGGLFASLVAAPGAVGLLAVLLVLLPDGRPPKGKLGFAAAAALVPTAAGWIVNAWLWLSFALLGDDQDLDSPIRVTLLLTSCSLLLSSLLLAFRAISRGGRRRLLYAAVPGIPTSVLTAVFQTSERLALAASIAVLMSLFAVLLLASPPQDGERPPAPQPDREAEA